jgi:hypothetical protein
MAERPTDLKAHLIDPIPGRYELLEHLGTGGMGRYFVTARFDAMFDGASSYVAPYWLDLRMLNFS